MNGNTPNAKTMNTNKIRGSHMNTVEKARFAIDTRTNQMYEINYFGFMGISVYVVNGTNTIEHKWLTIQDIENLEFVA